MTDPIPFDNSYVRLPDRFYARLDPTPVRAPKMIRINRGLAEALGIDQAWLASPDGLAVLAGNRVPTGAEPIATAYAGHQFANFVPQLGDGRAILLGEVVAPDGRRYDIQLKGSGPTPFSRMGDGRAALGPVLREYVVSEAMAALGVPTTRSLAAVLTGEGVIRETVLPGAVLTRVASSHIRVGTFQFFAARGDVDGLRSLADHVITRHYPEVAEAERPYRALLEAVAGRQGELVARWMLIGFIHGVMNTDNASIAGETIDYGPCAFMDAYHPATVYSSIDRQGRYAYGNQPRIAGWNMARLAEAMLPLLGDEDDAAIAEAQAALEVFGPRFDATYQAGLRSKLGLSEAREADLELIMAILEAMAANQVDFTLFFRRLADAALGDVDDEPVRSLFVDPTAFDAWAVRWRQRIADEALPSAERRRSMRAVNPAFIPRNHRVEAVIRAAVDADDFAPFDELMAVLPTPFEDQPGYVHFMDPPEPNERVLQTFCGT